MIIADMKCLEDMKREINYKRDELNKFIALGQERDKILRVSEELDILIKNYLRENTM